MSNVCSSYILTRTNVFDKLDVQGRVIVWKKFQENMDV